MKLSPKQAAAKEGVSRQLIYLWCAQGLPHYRFGAKGRRGRILIDEADLEAFIARCKVTAEKLPPPPPPPKGGTFTNLNSERLLEAWRRQGVIGGPRADSAPSSE